MFQNIANSFEDDKKNFKDVKLKNEEIGSFLKKAFTKQNIILYIIAFMISMVSFGGDISLGIAPFGLAILAAIAGTGIPISIVYIVTLIGSYIGLGKDITLNYFLTSLVFFATLFVIKTKKQSETNEKMKLGKNLIISIICVNIVPKIFTSITLSDVIFTIIMCLVTYIFYKIFVNAIDVIYEYGEKNVFSIEELMGASLLLAIAITALDPIKIFGFSLKNILCILIVLILGWRCGILIGTTGGVTIGVVLGIIGNEPPITIAAFALAGLLSGIFSKIGKIGVIIGFVIGNILITYVSNDNIQPIILFQEILIASLVLLLIPKKAEIAISELFDNSIALPEMTNKALDESKDTVNKLNDISETISALAKSYDEVAATVVDEKQDISIENENKKTFRNELNNNLENMKDNILYDDIKNSDDIFNDIFKYLNKNKDKKINKNVLISIFAKYNNYIIGTDEDHINKSVEKDIESIINIINKSYETSKINFIWKKKLEEKNKNTSVQLKGVSETIANLAEDIKENDTKEILEQKKMIRKILAQRGVKVTNLKIVQDESRYRIKITVENDGEDIKNTAKKIARVLIKVLDEKVSLQRKKSDLDIENKNLTFSFISSDKFDLKIGMAKSKKRGSSVSGDTSLQTKLDDGKYLLAISDGMDSGPEARKSSKIAIKMLERMLSSGFKKDVSVKMINAALADKSEQDMYATLDVLVLDLYNGNIEFIKNGACPTYIKRNKKVELINSISLPTGIIDNIDLVVYDKDVQDGDIIVMCSDGIIESNTEYEHKELWLKYFLEELQTDDVQQIADLIISEAIDNDYGKEKDDMSVIVAKISK